MNQSHNTRDPADLWLNEEDCQKGLIFCVTPLNTEFSYCLTGAKRWQLKTRSASPRDFFQCSNINESTSVDVSAIAEGRRIHCVRSNLTASGCSAYNLTF